MRTYGQLCPFARALDVLGERWALLVVRELLLGPKRFKQLLAAMPSAGTNRLTDRLRGLQEFDVIRKAVLPGTVGVEVYELTEAGEQLRAPLLALGLWGLGLPDDDRVDPTTARAELVALCLTGTQIGPLGPDRADCVEFQVMDEVFHLALRDGSYVARSGPAPGDPTLRVTCDLPTFVDLALRRLTPTDALKDGRAVIDRGTRRSIHQRSSVCSGTRCRSVLNSNLHDGSDSSTVRLTPSLRAE